MLVYYAIVHKDSDSAFGISFPDIPGCFSAADEEDDMLFQAQEALALYASNPEALPQARSIQDLKNDVEVQRDLMAGAFFIAVPFIAMDRKGRFNLMLDTSLVASVDRLANAVGVSRSEFVSRTLEHHLKYETGAVVLSRSASLGVLRESTGKVASAASKVMQSKTASKQEKSVAASTLTQKGATEQTSAKVATAASGILSSKTASAAAKSVAASALAQKNKAKKA